MLVVEFGLRPIAGAPTITRQASDGRDSSYSRTTPPDTIYADRQVVLMEDSVEPVLGLVISGGWLWVAAMATAAAAVFCFKGVIDNDGSYESPLGWALGWSLSTILLIWAAIVGTSLCVRGTC